MTHMSGRAKRPFSFSFTYVPNVVILRLLSRPAELTKHAGYSTREFGEDPSSRCVAHFYCYVSTRYKRYCPAVLLLPED